MRKQMILTVFICIALLTGCRQMPPDGNERSKEDNFSSMEETPDLSYEVPVSTPGILVDQLGYMAASTKIAIFKGKELPDVFYVIDAESSNCVYTGHLVSQGYNQVLDEYNSYGDFTDLQTPGEYYIEAPVLGRSYSFSIGDQVYDGIFEEACKQYYYNRCGMTLTAEYAGENAHNACHAGKAFLQEDASVSLDVTGGWHQDEKGQKNVVTAAQTMSTMLLSYELYENAFTDDLGIPESGNGIPDILDEVRYEVEWMLKMQDQQTGAVYAGLKVYVANGDAPGRTTDIYVESATPEAERAFAMALAKFSYLYQRFDNEYATNCLKAADRAWKHAELYETDMEEKEDKWKFAAATELYRAAGQVSYHRYVKDYLNTAEYWNDPDEIVLLGCVTYISTKQPVDFKLCGHVMEMLMDQAEKIADAAKSSIYLTSGNKEQDNNSQLLLEMMYLTVVNHIITNQEYETIIEDHLHYFLGRNDKAVSYIDNAGKSSYESIGSIGIMKQFDADSKLILILSEIIDSLNM